MTVGKVGDPAEAKNFKLLGHDPSAAWGGGSLVEIKNGPIFYPGIEEAVLQALERHRALDRSIVISFDHPSVLRFKELAPESRTGVLFVGRPVEPAQLAKEARADVLMPLWTDVTPELVASAHRAGLGVIPWTGDAAEAMRRIAGMGVDGIVTNRPDRLVAALG